MIRFRARLPLLTALASLTLVPPALAVPAKKPAPKPAAAVGTGNVTRAQMIAETKAIFNRADTNHDGFMSRKEFAARMGVVINANDPASKADAQRMLDAANAAFDNVDTNHDGKLSFAEASARPLRAFDMMDTNHDGVLTVAEKRAAHDSAQGLQVGPTQNGPPAGR